MKTTALKIKKVTLRDVAELAGIDKATASRALSGRGYASAQTRDLVLRAAKELGFQPDLSAQRLANGRSLREVALFFCSDLGVDTQLSWALSHALDDRGYEIEMHTIPLYVSHVAEKQIKLVNKIRRQKPGAIIAESSLIPDALPELRDFMAEGGVLASYGSQVSLDCDQVVFDVEGRAFKATRHLLELGHKKIGMCFHGPIQADSEELRGFKRALAQYSIALRPEWIFVGGQYERGGARFAEAYLGWKDKPTAMCIINDNSASACINVLKQNGVRVPEDLSIVSFDDSAAAQYAQVPLTSASYPLHEISAHLVEMTCSRLEGFQGPARRIEVEGHIVERQSCAPLPNLKAAHRKQKFTLPQDVEAVFTSGYSVVRGGRQAV